MTNDTDTSERLFKQLDDLVADVIDRFASEGHGTAVVIETLQDVLAKRLLAYDRDPDPAEDSINEPSNDWPAADRRPDQKE